MRTPLLVAVGIVVVLLVLLGGFLVPAPLADAPAGASDGGETAVVAVPDGLPDPVDRWLRSSYPDGVPLVDSLVMRGRGVMRIGSIPVPMRHTIEIHPGEGFVRRMDLTWYGIAFAHGKDVFTGGHGVMTTPVGTYEGEKIDQGANMVNWIEALAAPGVLITDPAVRWEPIDESSARLVFPFGDADDEVTMFFDPETGAPTKIVAMRYKDADADARKLVWTARMMDRRVLGGLPVATEVDATWQGFDKPWATFRYTDVWFGASLGEFVAE